MDTKKSIAVCVTAFLYIMLFAVVGSCFMAFKYEDEKVIVLDPEIVKSEGVKVLSINDTEIDYLDFSEVKLGLKPVTGDLYVVTKIPVTVTDQNGSEGIYAKFKVDSSIKRTLKITNISITGNDKLDIQKERKNIWVSVKEINDSTKNFEDNEIILGEISNNKEKEYTLLFWLSSVASEEFKETTISFKVEII